MFKLFSRKWFVACIIAGSLLGVSTCAVCQPRITGSFGLTSNKKVLGKASAGYDVGKVVFNYELMSSLPKGYTLHGPTVGITVKEHFIPFVGYNRVEFGNKNPVDRYKTDTLFSNLRTNTWSIPFGVNYIYENFYVSAGYAAGKYRFGFITVGVTKLFD